MPRIRNRQAHHLPRIRTKFGVSFIRSLYLVPVRSFVRSIRFRNDNRIIRPIVRLIMARSNLFNQEVAAEVFASVANQIDDHAFGPPFHCRYSIWKAVVKPRSHIVCRHLWYWVYIVVMKDSRSNAAVVAFLVSSLYFSSELDSILQRKLTTEGPKNLCQPFPTPSCTTIESIDLTWV